MSIQDKALMLEAMEAHDWDFDSMAVSNGWLEPRAAIDLEVRADYAESLLCAMAFDHQRIMLGPTFWYCDRESRDGPCMFCEAYR